MFIVSLKTTVTHTFWSKIRVWEQRCEHIHVTSRNSVKQSAEITYEVRFPALTVPTPSTPNTEAYKTTRELTSWKMWSEILQWNCWPNVCTSLICIADVVATWNRSPCWWKSLGIRHSELYRKHYILCGNSFGVLQDASQGRGLMSPELCPAKCDHFCGS